MPVSPHLSARSCSTAAIKARLTDLMPDSSRDPLLEDPALLNTVAVGVPRLELLFGNRSLAVAEEVSPGLTFLKCKSYHYNSFLLSVAWHSHLLVWISLFSYSFISSRTYFYHENFGVGTTLYTSNQSDTLFVSVTVKRLHAKCLSKIQTLAKCAY